MENDRNNNSQKRPESYTPVREDSYQYYYFSSGDFPGGELLSKQIQAQSYVNRGLVHPEGLITVEDGKQILAPDIATPSDVSLDHHIEYIVGCEKGSIDFDPNTGKLVTWKKNYAPIDSLPTYTYCKDSIWNQWNKYLREVDENPNLKLVEPEGLGKTENAGRGVVTEFMRNEIQRAMGKGEIWFMGLVEQTVYKSFVHNWGPYAVRQIGEPKQLDHPHVDESVNLVPSVMNIDRFFYNFAHAIVISGNDYNQRLLGNFVYMTEGMSDKKLGPQIAEFRAHAEQVLKERKV